MRTVCYSRRADEALASMPMDRARAIERKIEQYSSDPMTLAGQVKALRGSVARRLRVGDYRIIFTEDMVVLDVIAIGHRSSVYD